MGDLIDVSAAIDNPDTRKRELRSLEEGMQALELSNSLLLTADHEETVKTENGIIQIMPTWKWLCDK